MLAWILGGEEKKERKKKAIIPEGYTRLSINLRDNFFNSIIYGKTKSGKTYFLLNIMYPMIRDLYDKVYIFSRASNYKTYKEAIPNCVFIDHDHGRAMKDLLNFQIYKNIDEEKSKKDKHQTIYKDNFLIIWDDILDEKLFKDDIFKSQFFNGRHYQISVILLTQVSNKIITTDIKGNTQVSIYFKIVDVNQLNSCRRRIEEALVNQGYDEKKSQAMAVKIMREEVINKDYGMIAISDASEFLYPMRLQNIVSDDKKKLPFESSDEDNDSHDDED